MSRALKTHASIKHVGSTKNGVSRTLPIDGIALNTLARMVKRITTAKETGLQESYKLYTRETDSELKGIYGFIMKGYYEWLRFKDLRDCPLTRLDLSTANARWRRVKKELNLNKDYTLYTLRHTLATRLVTLRKFSAHKLMSYLGHTSIQTSLKYVHLNVDDIRDGYGVGIN
ncbi:tyrosine-type recombinase/integrase [Campylobacter gastrosuis]|uniref:tyrosine-type recombinase/integrase n=1 Tax=Campylobacter gastrosuis TaxID=2974576 RepID=UPI0032C21DFA